MMRRGSARRVALIATCVAISGSGCAFGGLNSLPLPGTVGHGAGSTTYHIQLANVGQLESNSPVLVGDVVVGSVGKMTVTDWHADVEVSVKPGVVIPANAVATVGQTSLLGSMHLGLNPPLGQAPSGVLQPGATLGLNRSSTYPSTEQTLSALSVVVNGGGLGQIGDIVKEFNAALGGREDKIRDLLSRLNDFVGLLADQRDSINVGGHLAEQPGRHIRRAARGSHPGAQPHSARARRPGQRTPADRHRAGEVPRLLQSGHRTGQRHAGGPGAQPAEPGADLEGARRRRPQAGHCACLLPDLPVHAERDRPRPSAGDYLNQFIIFDLTVPRLKRTLFLGTSWGDPNAKLVPAPGDPFYAMYTYDPLHAPFSPPPKQLADVPPLNLGGPAAATSSQAALTDNTAPAAATVPGPPPGPGNGPPPGPDTGPLPGPGNGPPPGAGSAIGATGRGR